MRRNAPPLDVPEDIQCFSVRATARLLAMSESTLWRERQAGRVPEPLEISPQRRVYTLRMIRELLAARARQVETAR